MFELTAENYHSAEANKEYMGFSRYSDWMRCEDAAYARYTGEYDPPPTEPMMLGTAFHNVVLEGADPDIEFSSYTINGKKTTVQPAKKKQLLAMNLEVERQKKEPCGIVGMLMEGEKEVIVTGELGGLWWKGKVDVLGRRWILDIKTSDGREKKFNEAKGAFESWWVRWCYARQAAVYSYMHGKGFPFLVLKVTKSERPAIELYEFTAAQMAIELSSIDAGCQRIIEVKSGATRKRCETCDYCKATKVITEAIILG